MRKNEIRIPNKKILNNLDKKKFSSRFEESLEPINFNKSKTKKRKSKLKSTDFMPLLDASKCEFPKVRNNWRAKSHNKDKQLKEYIKHTYFKYDVPNFIYYEILNNKDYDELINENGLVEFSPRYFPYSEDMFIGRDLSVSKVIEAIIEAKSLKPYLKKILTKKSIDKVLKSKEETLIKAITKEYLKEKKFEKSTIDYFYNERLLLRNDYDDVVKMLVKIIEKAPDLFTDYNKVRELRDYLRANTIYVGYDLCMLEVGVPRENLKTAENYIKKSIEKILEDSDDWHVENTILKRLNKSFWKQRFEIFESSNDVFITEITDSKTLLAEGKSLGHCVASYANWCGASSNSILSMTNKGMRVLTIQVEKSKIIQAKGKRNKEITESQMFHLEKFAKANNLEIDKKQYL